DRIGSKTEGAACCAPTIIQLRIVISSSARNLSCVFKVRPSKKPYKDFFLSRNDRSGQTRCAERTLRSSVLRVVVVSYSDDAEARHFNKYPNFSRAWRTTSWLGALTLGNLSLHSLGRVASMTMRELVKSR